MLAITLLNWKFAVPVTVVWPLQVIVVAPVTLISEVIACVTCAFVIPCCPALSVICASVGAVFCGFRNI
jgi:hypothetical protein